MTPRGLGLTNNLRFGYARGGPVGPPTIPDILGEDLVAYYDAVRQGGSPQLLTWADDPTNPVWVTTRVTVTTGQSDSTGGTDAWLVEPAGISSADRFEMPTLKGGVVGSVALDIKRVAVGASGVDLTVLLRNATAGATDNTTAEIVSGPGSWDVETSSGAHKLSGLSTSQWTRIRLSPVSAPATATDDYRWWAYTGSSSEAAANQFVVFRPTVQLGTHDGKLYKSEGAVPALVKELKDFSGNDYHQPISAGSQPIYVADAGDGLPAWWWDGNAKTSGVAIASVALPGYKWSCQNFDAAAAGVSVHIEDGTGAGRWYIYKPASDIAYAHAGGSFTRAGTPTPGSFDWIKAKFHATDNSAWMNGVAGDSGELASNTLDGIRTGSTSTGSLPMLGYIRSSVTAKTALTPEKIAAVDEIFDLYMKGILP